VLPQRRWFGWPGLRLRSQGRDGATAVAANQTTSPDPALAPPDRLLRPGSARSGSTANRGARLLFPGHAPTTRSRRAPAPPRSAPPPARSSRCPALLRSARAGRVPRARRRGPRAARPARDRGRRSQALRATHESPDGSSDLVWEDYPLCASGTSARIVYPFALGHKGRRTIGVPHRGARRVRSAGGTAHAAVQPLIIVRRADAGSSVPDVTQTIIEGWLESGE
jgi:hypothetical protein